MIGAPRSGRTRPCNRDVDVAGTYLRDRTRYGRATVFGKTLLLPRYPRPSSPGYPRRGRRLFSIPRQRDGHRWVTRMRLAPRDRRWRQDSGLEAASPAARWAGVARKA